MERLGRGTSWLCRRFGCARRSAQLSGLRFVWFSKGSITYFPPFWKKAVTGAFYALRFPMCPQKPSPHLKIGNPTDLVNKFVLLARVVLVVPHHAIFCFVVLVDTGQSHRNWKSRCVCVSRTHEQTHSNPVSIPASRASRCSPDGNRFG
jgi:hypothetical protein